MKQNKITKSARGRRCEIQLPGYCTHNEEQTVLCHLGGGGMGGKSPDSEGAYGCYVCHQIVDGSYKTDLERDFVRMCFFEAAVRTREILRGLGLLVEP